MSSTGSRTPRSSSRSRAKRSTTNLSDLRLAPLTTTLAPLASEARADETGTPRSPYDRTQDVTYSQQHSSYIQGKSAPSTPGILSRSSSRRNLSGGLSRRGSLYDDEVQYQYGAVRQDQEYGNSERVAVGTAHIPKAKSEAALLIHQRDQRLTGRGVPLKRRHQGRPGTRTGSTTPRPRDLARQADDQDWLARTRAATHDIVQEAKGQSWLASRESSTTLHHLESSDDDDVDEGYEEMAAMSAADIRSTHGTRRDGRLSPEVVRRQSAKIPIWGSRYGSRSASRGTSRRGSTNSLRTPLGNSNPNPNLSQLDGYFADDPLTLPAPTAGGTMEPDFINVLDGDEGDEEGPSGAEEEVARLSDQRGYGIGGIVERIMSFNLFSVQEKGEESGSEEEVAKEEERGKIKGEEEGRKGQEAEQTVRAPSLPPAPAADVGDAGGEGGWQDAAWLLSVASRALF
ncbi:hypothetical protein LTR78_006323 [Recurvomyces mirabilis]|uniref:Uncharacterized protein n=1 Tax=Recurvomyces mirabilis TaxID=574656 RepID=A0AAE0WL88_9PEZI|nr:hypothetical protein LTR78_006323 [Recurvomyces mirabilis]KAK5152212.1 hypothetical protein LTS14_008587 [Recurvomyces mirabilis]